MVDAHRDPGRSLTTADQVIAGTKRREPRLPLVDAFLEAKLTPPAVRTKWVPRDRLVRALELSTAECPLTLIAAPAGYGKTTAVAQWLGQMTSRNLAWVALDAADNDPVRLWTHIATALERAGCLFGGGAASLVAQHRADITSGLLPELVNALAGAGSLVLVLDDYHFVRSAACHEQVDFLIGHLPPTVSVVILTRADPDLRLGRLRAARQLAEIRAESLSFDVDEATALLATEDISLSGVALRELMERTEGWPAGLYLAAMSLLGREDPDAYVHEFTGNNRYIGDYLIEEVLGRQSSEVRTFILDVSIFERFSAALCKSVLQMPGAGRIVHDLERSNLFLVPLDARRQWFRFHHLFATVARSELEARDPTRVQRLHTRAADWFASRGLVDEAVEHAISAGATARASELVQANWIRYVDAGRAATVEGWLSALRAFESEADPAALVTSAWMALVAGDEASLNGLLLALSDVEDDSPLPDGTRSVESAVALLQGMSGYGGPLKMASAAQRASELETDRHSPWFGFANFILGHQRYVAGDLEAAMSVLPTAAYSDSSFAMIRQFALSLMSMIARERGEESLSRRYATEAMVVVDAASLRAVPQAAMALTAFAESQAEAGDLAGALATLEEAATLRQRTPGLSPWPGFYLLLAMGRVATTTGDLTRAEQSLSEVAEQMARFSEGMGAMHDRLKAALARLRQRNVGPGVEPLTAREIDVLRLLPSQLSLSEIAGELFLTRNTVKTHAHSVYRKLGASSRSEAVHLGRQRSLI
jgi:LuxR family transcriptional regulator, maltose regulon positive regulatory protein